MNKVIVITGTSRGLGKAVAQHYQDKGYCVIGCSRGKATVKGDNYSHYQLDITKEKEVIEVVYKIRKKYGKVDALLNNAGIASMNHLLMTPYEIAKNVFDTNFFGTFIFMREIGKIMVKQKYGRIINYSTIAVPLNLEGEAIYAASKAAIEQLTRIAAKELAPFKITVNAIGPTPIKTDLIKNIPAVKIEKLLNQQAIKRFGEFPDVINVLDFFLNDKSEFITGQVIYLGGVN